MSPDVREGIRAGLPFGFAALLLGLSFGVLAEPVMGGVAAIVMSAVVFAGATQFAATAVLAAGGSAVAAIVAGVLLSARFLPMGIAIAGSMPGGRGRRGLEAQAINDASWAMAHEGGGRFSRDKLLGSTLPQYPGWLLGTVLGVVFGDLLGDPDRIGLDAIFPAFFLALLIVEMRDRVSATVALLGAGVALVLISLVPAGLPVVAAALVALLGLRRRP